MNKKLIALAVASAFAAPAAALAQASNVQIYGTMYVEYGYVKQGALLNGNMPNMDFIQVPGSSIGFRGEEALGGGLSAWFQCESTAAISGATASGGGGVFCGRNSALGMKGNFGNAYVGNWDTPFKRSVGLKYATDTAFFGASGLMYGSSASAINRAAPGTWARRENQSIMYDTPTWNGFSGMASMSTPNLAQTAVTSATSGAKARLWSIGGTYTNGPLSVGAAYENHSNFQPAANGTAGAATGFAGNDNAFTLSARYQFGPLEAGVGYTKQKFETAPLTNADVSAVHLVGSWAIAGPHTVQLGYTKANSTGGSFAGAIGPRVYNAGAGQTGASLLLAEYLYAFSKRTRGSIGYARVANDTNATYSIFGYNAPTQGGVNQDGVAMSLKTTF